MKVLYLMTAPPPAIAGTDAVEQEVSALAERFEGDVVFLPPSRRPTSHVPRSFYGFQCLSELRRREREADLIHIYHAELYPFPILGRLSRPTVYSVVSGVQETARFSSRRLLDLAAVVVPTEGDRKLLEARGFQTVETFPPAIDMSRIRPTPAPASGDFTLLAGSAPWTRKQFRSKGIDTLLELVHRDPGLRLVLLWRGWLTDQIKRRVQRLGLEDRVEIITERIAIAELFQRVHAAVVLAEKSKLVKAYPHSLLEALACGRPVLVSSTLPMSDLVSDSRCGTVASCLGTEQVAHALAQLRENYQLHCENARIVATRDFSLESLATAYGSLYERLLT